jgi:methyltransferase (TIGR00027 family)
MRDDSPSLTARGVVLARSLLDRPTIRTGDADVELRLAASLSGEAGTAAELRSAARRAPDGFADFLVARTEFFDAAVVAAPGAGIAQIVILGAGYDCRAMRFRSPGMQFYEVDHPATQRDKLARLAELGADVDDVRFVAADFTEPGLEDTMASAGFDAQQPTLFLCEGLLRYLPARWFKALLASAAALGSPGSELAASIATRHAGSQDDDGHERAREALLAQSGEPVLTVPLSDVAVAWVRESGWPELEVRDVAEIRDGARRGRLLVHARR